MGFNYTHIVSYGEIARSNVLPNSICCQFVDENISEIVLVLEDKKVSYEKNPNLPNHDQP